MHRWLHFPIASLICLASLHVHAQNGDIAGARDAYKKREYANAVKLLQPLVEGGNADAMVLLGRMHLAGQGVVKDESAAVDLFKKGADANNAEAIFYLARQIHSGNGLPKDEKQAVALYLKSGQLGNADGQLWYALSIYRGYGGMTPNKAASFEWFLRAAEQGQSSAQNWVGVLHDSGDGVEKNAFEAIKWYRKAALQLEPNAQRNLGVRYAMGQGVARDDAEALKWLLSAAYLRDAVALEWVGSFYEHGRSVVPDPLAAYMWYSLLLAREPASTSGKTALARVAEKLTPAQITEAQTKAKQWPVSADLLRAIAATGIQNAPSPGTATPTAARPNVPSKSGTGFVMGSPQRYVVTNFHVIKSCKSLRAMPMDLVATLRAKDERNDLALLDVPGLNAPPLKLRTGRSIRPGDDLVTLGFPLAGLLASGASVSTGTLTNLGGIDNDTTRFQISVPTQPGNSGGPVLDTYGQVVGVVVAQINAVNLSQTIGSIPQNVNFAINTASLSSFLDASGVDHDLSQTQQDAKAKKLDAADIGALGRKSTVKVECLNN
nr:tetratricopeptide repeat-containing serine protease family protein [uncultured Rhodoferax sp.]